MLFDPNFDARKVERGDYLYIITNKKGILHLAAKVQATKVNYKRNRYYDDTIKIDVVSTIDTDRVIPPEFYPDLRFIRSDGERPPVLKSNGLLDQQTLRLVSQLTPESAEFLDGYL